MDLCEECKQPTDYVHTDIMTGGVELCDGCHEAAMEDVCAVLGDPEAFTPPDFVE